MATTLFVNPLAASLLKVSPWVPLIFGNIVLFVGMLAVFLIPETLDIRRATDRRIEQQIHQEGRGTVHPDAPLADDDAQKTRGVWDRIVATMKNDMVHVWRFLIGSKGIMLLILALALNMSTIHYLASYLARQYIHKRYDVDWSDVSPFPSHLYALRNRKS